MPRPRKYAEELIRRGVRLVLESDRPIAQIAADLGIPPETLRKFVRWAEERRRAKSNGTTSAAAFARRGGDAAKASKDWGPGGKEMNLRPVCI